MVVTTEIEKASRELADLVKQVQAGNEVLVTQGDKPVARLVSATQKEMKTDIPFRVRSLPGHRVLTGVISQEELAEEMFGRQ
jgi:prevent-host-death family protein